MKFNARLVTVEPAMFFFEMASFIQYPSLQALYYTKVCNQHFNNTICENIRNETFKEEEKLVQSETSSWILYHNLTFSIPAIIVAIFMGSWSDRISRRLPVMFPVIGGILSSLVLVLNSVYIDWPISVCLVAAVFGSLCGGFVLFIGSVFSYVGHIASDTNRTTRIAILEAMLFIGGTFGSVFGGLMIDDLGFVFTFAFALGLNVLVLIYLLIWVPNIDMAQTGETGNKCRQYFNIQYFVESCFVMFRRRPGNARRRIILLVILLGVVYLTTSGTIDIAFLFLKHPPLSWTQTLYGVYSSLSLGLKGLLLLTLVPVLRWLFSIQDTTFILIGLLSKMSGLVLLGVTMTTWMGMLSPVIGMLQGWPAACTRAMLSAHVSKGEQGKLFAVVASIEAALTLTSASIFNSVYPTTLTVYPGLMFIMAGVALIIPIVIIIFIQCDLQNESTHEDMEDMIDGQDNVQDIMDD